MNQLVECPDSGLMLPREFIDERRSLAKFIRDWVDKVCSQMSHLDKPYFIMFNGKFNQIDPSQFEISSPVVTLKLPPFKNNSIVWWVCNTRSVNELLWMVSPTVKGEKLKVEFNKEGVAYLQAKGAMPRTA